MVPPLYAFFLKSAFLVLEAQQVIALRMLCMASGGAAAERELQRMWSEKFEAAGQAGVDAMLAMVGGKSGSAIADGTVHRYRTRVRQNRRRLTKR